MTNLQKKEFLAQYRWNEQEIVRLREEIMQWHRQSGQLTAESGLMEESQTEEKMLECAGKMMELEKEMAFQLGEKIRLRKEIGQAIEEVQQGNLKHLLRLRYINGCKWDEIGQKMNYDVRWVRRLHNKALEKVVLNH